MAQVPLDQVFLVSMWLEVRACADVCKFVLMGVLYIVRVQAVVYGTSRAFKPQTWMCPY